MNTCVTYLLREGQFENVSVVLDQLIVTVKLSLQQASILNILSEFKMSTKMEPSNLSCLIVLYISLIVLYISLIEDKGQNQALYM